MGGLRIAVDLGAFSIKMLAQKKARRKNVIVAGTSIRTPQGSIDEGGIKDAEGLSKQLRELISPYGSDAELYLTLALPSLIHRHMVLPRVKKNRMGTLVEMQMEQMLSGLTRDYLVQYRINGTYVEDNVIKNDVTAFAIPTKVMVSLAEVLEQSGLKPHVLDVQPNCAAKLIESGMIDIGERNTGTIAFIDLGYTMTGLHFAGVNGLKFTRMVSMGAKAVDEAIGQYYQVTSEEAERMKRVHSDLDWDNAKPGNLDSLIRDSLEPLTLEIQRAFRFYLSKNPGDTVSEAVLYGGMAKIGGLDRYLSGILNCPVIAAEDLAMPDFPDEGRNTHPADFINCLGVLSGKNGGQAGKI